MTTMRVRNGLLVALVIIGVLLAGCGSGKGSGMTIVITTASPQTSHSVLGAYRVPSGSMEPTYPIGDRVEVESAEPRVGDVVVFHPPEGAIEERCGAAAQITPGGAACSESVPSEASIKFLKRIVARPGDTIKIIEGHVIRNGRRESDSYIKPCPGVAECSFPVAITVPAGEWFLAGDNRGESDDSRFWGPVPTSWIVGVVRHGFVGA
jgi:signal peptidase I